MIDQEIQREREQVAMEIEALKRELETVPLVKTRLQELCQIYCDKGNCWEFKSALEDLAIAVDVI